MNRVQKCFLHLQQLPSANIIWNGNTNRSKKNIAELCIANAYNKHHKIHFLNIQTNTTTSNLKCNYNSPNNIHKKPTLC